MSGWTYFLRGYYADDVKPPKKPGGFAIEIGGASGGALRQPRQPPVRPPRRLVALEHPEVSVSGDEPQCQCVPQVFARRHNDELLVAWFWPGGPMWLQPGGGVPVEVTSGEFATTVELGWTQLEVVDPGMNSIEVMSPTGPVTFELIR